MYLAVDIGGSKTLLAVFSEDGQVIASHKIPTNRVYKNFLKDIESVLSGELKEYKISRCCAAVPGKVNRRLGIAETFGNLGWRNVPLQKDLQKILGGTPVLIGHDGPLGGLGEALLVHKKYRKVLYITLGTGIGSGIIIDGKIDPDFADMEAGQMVINYEGKLQKWEDIASGRALKAAYGKRASDIADPKIWDEFARRLAPGVNALCAILQPDAIIFGGGVGVYLEKFNATLGKELAKLENNMVHTPPIIKAKRPEEAVIYGCYNFIKQHN